MSINFLWVGIPNCLNGKQTLQFIPHVILEQCSFCRGIIWYPLWNLICDLISLTFGQVYQSIMVVFSIYRVHVQTQKSLFPKERLYTYRSFMCKFFEPKDVLNIHLVRETYSEGTYENCFVVSSLMLCYSGCVDCGYIYCHFRNNYVNSAEWKLSSLQICWSALHCSVAIINQPNFSWFPFFISQKGEQFKNDARAFLFLNDAFTIYVYNTKMAQSNHQIGLECFNSSHLFLFFFHNGVQNQLLLISINWKISDSLCP